jgi:hypothetical protein
MTFKGILREFQGIEGIGSPMSCGKFVFKGI